MTEAQSSDVLKNPELFMSGQAILGTLIALVIYFGADLPVQPALLRANANAYPATPDDQIP